ncbi:MAG: FAD-dependent oxidoreductase [Euryarchaeota archaeon]|nr:FAD-dependent oxidoreductase [Euryarchaeota archaeon]
MIETDVLIIGGGVAGMTVASELAEEGLNTVIVEKGPALGGRLPSISHVFPTMEHGREISSKMTGWISILTGSGKLVAQLASIVDKVTKDNDLFVSEVLKEDGSRDGVRSKAVVMATGLEPIDASIIPEFGLGAHKDVITSVQLEEMLSSGSGVHRPSNGAVPRTITFVQCVGSRVERRGVRYCSNVCCLNAIKNASLLRDLSPDTRSYILYIDIRSHGKGYEDAYKEARRRGVTFIRGQPSLVLDKEGKLLVCGENTLLKELYEIESELVVLSVGLRTPETNQMMFGAAGIDMSKDGLPVCENELLLAESSKMKGVFFAGSVEAPKDIRDTVLHSKACALAVTKYLKG